MPADAAFCPGCGRPMRIERGVQGKAGPVPVNLAGALAYFSFVPAMLFLLVDPYRKNRFVRFHSIQSLLLCGTVIVLGALLRIAGLIVFLIPVLGPLVVALAYVVVGLAAVLLWVVLVVKAFQGEMFKLPLLGESAERHTDRG